MKKYFILLLFTIIGNLTSAQKCKNTKFTVLSMDTTSSKNYAYITFYSSKTLLKQIWWNKLEHPTKKFEIGKTYKLKLKENIGMHSIDDSTGQVYYIYSCRANAYYSDNVKHEEFKFCE